ncbi:MAG: hypothetical protein U9O18_03320 [Chloroflexota bacterium]|nr:hypothetical protein [Chloroflexota bacterium]
MTTTGKLTTATTSIVLLLVSATSVAGNLDQHMLDSDAAGSPRSLEVQSTWYTVENENGTWNGHATGIVFPDGSNTDTITLSGDGAYDGLTAYLLVDCTPAVPEVRGVIFPGAMPEAP